MARPVGRPDLEEVITITVPKENVLTAKRTRYVFIDTFLSGIRRLSLSQFGTLSLYIRVVKTFERKLYNTVTIYGLEAIDIDSPHSVVVSAWLKFVVVDTVEDVKPCSYTTVQKKHV